MGTTGGSWISAGHRGPHPPIPVYPSPIPVYRGPHPAPLPRSGLPCQIFPPEKLIDLSIWGSVNIDVIIGNA